METSPDFVNLFTTESGELFYFVAILFIYLGALLMAFDQRQRSKDETSAARYVASLSMANLAWFVLMGGALLSVVSDSIGNDLMPPLESAINAIIIIALCLGLLVSDDRDEVRIEFTVGGMLIVLLSLGMILTLTTWDSTRPFFDQIASLSWTFVPLIILCAAALLLITQYSKTADIPLKLLFMVILAAGHGYTMFGILEEDLMGDTSGALRWSFLVSGLILLLIVYRMVIDRMKSAIEEVATYAETISKPLKIIQVPSDKPIADTQLDFNVKAETAGTNSIGGRNEALELLKALGIMLDKDDTNTLPYQTVQAVAEMIRADIVVMISYDDSDWSDIVAAYDFGRKQPIAGMSLNLSAQPTIRETLKTKRQLLLTDDEHKEELKDLYTRFDMSIQGSTYVQPMTRHGQVIGALIAGFPYQRRVLRSNETSLLESIGPIAARLMVLSRTARIERVKAEERAISQLVDGIEPTEDESASSTAVLAMRKEMQESLQLAQNEINELNQHIQQLEDGLRQERERIEDVLVDIGDDDVSSFTERIATISEERRALERERRNLATALQEAKSTLIGFNNPDDLQQVVEQLNIELKSLRQQRDNLEEELATLRDQRPHTAADAEKVVDKLLAGQEFSRQTSRKLQARLDDTQSQIAALGIIPGDQKLLEKLAEVTQERDKYKAVAGKVLKERNLLLNERQQLNAAIKNEQERSERIQALEQDLLRMTQDREAVSKQRDDLQTQLSSLDKATEDARTQHNVLQSERDQALEILARANQSRESLALERNEAVAERDLLFTEVERLKHELAVLKSRVEGDRDRLEALGSEGMDPLHRMIDEMTQERVLLENNLARATREVDTLQQELALYRGTQPEKPPSLAVNMDVIVSLAQELRSPLSVIMGYTDTVLNESVGILGALQRKLLTRVKANVDRLAYLVEELVQISVVDSGELKLEPQKVNLIDIIDDTISASRYKFSEKGIVIDMDIDSDDLWLQVDEEAMRQIMHHMIQNAYLVSPTDGTVIVTAKHQNAITVPGVVSEDFSDVMLVSVRDEGGGIRPEDEGRVFTRLYRAENPLIEGLGDTGVGMSITKALIEAHGGRVWLESQTGVGNTFKFIVPVQQPVLQSTGEDPDLTPA